MKGDFIAPYNSLKRGCEVGISLFLQVTVVEQEVMASSCARGGSGWILGKCSSPKEQCCSGTAARGGGGVTIPGGVPELWGCGTEGCGQWVWWWWAGVGLGDISDLFQR